MEKILIIGRPNVGKSSLFNRLIKKRRALVLDQAGVTRDILKAKTSWWGHSFEVWDSGGFAKGQGLPLKIKKQIQRAVKKADRVLLVLDAKAGFQAEDRALFKLIQNKKHLLIVNKVDQPLKMEDELHSFFKLGSEFIQASFEKNENVHLILEWILKNKSLKNSIKEDKKMTIFISGAPNAGKSSLCNQILKEERMITSPTPHTTTDAAGGAFQFKNQNFEILDSAGVRRKSLRSSDLEKLSSVKTMKHFKKADLILLVVDSVKGFTKQDIRLLSYFIENNKAFMILMNKWDLMQGEPKIKWRKKIKESLPFFESAPVLFISALSGAGLPALMKKIDEWIHKMQIQIPTARLNRFFSQTLSQAPLPVFGTRNIKFYYMTQVKTGPPSFLVFTNRQAGVPSSYKKFLIKRIQKGFGLEGLPVEIHFSGKNSGKTSGRSSKRTE